MLAIGGKVLRGPDLLQGGLLRVVPRHGPGEHRLPRGPVPHPVGSGGVRGAASAAALYPAGQVGGPREGPAGEGLPFGPGRARRVRRPGHHVRGVLLAGAGHAHVEHLPVHARGHDQPGGVDRHALAGVEVPGVGELGALLEVGHGHGERGGPPARPGSAARRPRTGFPAPRKAISRSVSRLVSRRPPASMPVFSRARTRSPAPAGLPSRSVTSRLPPIWPRSIRRSRTRRASRAASSLPSASSSACLPRATSVRYRSTASS